jgi:hypothetical protein
MELMSVISLNLSGVIGIFWYREITEPSVIRKWFLSALACVTGIIWLSRERILAKVDAVDDDKH